MLGVNREDKINNEYNISIEVALIIDKMRNRSRWFWYVLRKEDTEVVRLIKRMYVKGKKREDLKKRWGI